MRPLLGSSTPRIMLMVVVLPAPLGPSSPTISPGAIENDRPSTASVPPYALRRFETSRIDIKKKGAGSSTAPGEFCTAELPRWGGRPTLTADPCAGLPAPDLSSCRQVPGSEQPARPAAP